ncbi:MAG: hypothetical protein U0996_25695 [Planctomycetaceae bacterium]
MVSSEIAANTEGLSWERNGTENRLSIDAPSTSGQPGKVYELALYGRRMGDVLKMLSKHLFGWILTIAFLLSGIVCISAVLAWLMRQCWSPTAMALLPCFGFNTDIERAFFPAFVACLLWAGSLVLQRVCQIFGWRVPPTSRVTYVTLLCSIVLGILVLLGIDDVGIDDWMELYGLPESLKGQLQSLIHGIAAVATVAVTATLIPFFSPKSLLNSGRRDSSFWQRTIFNFAGYGVVFALPLFVFYFIARENIANRHSELCSLSEMSPSRLRNFDDFIWELRAESDNQISKGLLTSLGNADDLNTWLEINRKTTMDLGSSHVLPFLRYCFEWFQPGVSGGVEEKFYLRSAQERLMQEFAAALTKECLSDSKWFTERRNQNGLILNQFMSRRDTAGEIESDPKLQTIHTALEELRRLQFLEVSLCGECIYSKSSTDNLSGASTEDSSSDLTESVTFAKRQKKRAITGLELLVQLEAELQSLSDTGTELAEPRYVAWLTSQHKRVKALLSQIRTQNTRILEQLYPKYIGSASVIYARDVNRFDQDRRLQLAFWGLVVFLVVGLLSNVNNGSLHSVYRDEIAEVWLPSKSLLVKDLNTCRRGGPMHLINCTMNHLSSALDPDAERQSRFVVSHRFVGSKRTGYRRTEDFQDGKLTVADAVAISGAAVTVTAADNLLYRVLLVLTNFRLGQWLRNPANYHPDHFWPSPLRTLLGLLWDPQDRAFCYVSDGGHLDNTGLAALFERRCRLIIASDASDDPDYSFEDLIRLLQASRAKYNLEFQVLESSCESAIKSGDVLDRIRPNENAWSNQHFVAFRVIYPKQGKEESLEGLLVVVKSSLTGDEPLDLLELKRRTASFPHDPTSNQFLPPSRFESYVMLGRHMANDVLNFIGNSGTELRLPDSVKAWMDTLNDDSSGRKVIEPPALHLAPQDPFSEETIARAGLMLNEWKVTPQNETTAEDEVVAEVSKWARHFGAASLSLRKRFCRHLVTIVDENLDRLRYSKSAMLEFDSMLLMLGKNIPEAARARKMLKDRTQASDPV